MKKEIWKDITGYEGLYQISNLGRVKSLQRKHYFPKTDEIFTIKKEIILNLHIMRGYVGVTLNKNNKAKTHLIHRLIANAFIENKYNKPQINHIDGNKLNNNINNLEWCTASENVIHAFKTGLKKAKKGDKNACSKSVLQYTKNNEFIKKYGSTKEAEREKQANHSAIIRCCKNKQKTAGGYIWRYEKCV